MQTGILNFFVMMSLACVLTSQPAFAGTDYEEGVKLYEAKEYAKAGQLFERAIEQEPKSWKAHYYLAHVCFALHKMARAKYEYEQVQKLCTDQSILKNCKASLRRIETFSAASRANADNSATRENLPSDAEVQKEKRKEEIMKLAREDCERVKLEMKEHLETEGALNGRRWRDRETGRRYFDISKARKGEIQREYDEKCRRIMEEAEKKVKLMR